MYTVTYLLLQKEVCTHVALLEPLTQGFFVSIWVGDDPRWRPSPLLAFPLCAWGSALGLLLHGVASRRAPGGIVTRPWHLFRLVKLQSYFSNCPSTTVICGLKCFTEAPSCCVVPGRLPGVQVLIRTFLLSTPLPALDLQAAASVRWIVGAVPSGLRL